MTKAFIQWSFKSHFPISQRNTGMLPGGFGGGGAPSVEDRGGLGGFMGGRGSRQSRINSSISSTYQNSFFYARGYWLAGNYLSKHVLINENFGMSRPFLTMLMNEAASSGMLVPMATIVSPTMKSLILGACAKLTAPKPARQMRKQRRERMTKQVTSQPAPYPRFDGEQSLIAPSRLVQDFVTCGETDPIVGSLNSELWISAISGDCLSRILLTA